MAGRKNFVAGEILLAADVNAFLMDQSVMVFDNDDARAAAIPTPSEGMTTYLKDLDAVEFFDGSVFRRVGGLIAVKSAIRDTTQVFASLGPGTNVAVGGLEITHEVADPANRLIISAFFGAASNSGGTGAVGLAIHDGSDLIVVGATDGIRTSVTAGGLVQGTGVENSNLVVAMPSVTFVHTPGSGSKTYTVRALNVAVIDQSIFINRTQSDTNAESRTRSVSSLVIQEVAV